MQSHRGAFVTDLHPGSAAAEAGLQLGDVITAVDGKAVSGPDDVGAAIRDHKPGDQITVTYERDGTVSSTDVQLGRRGDSGN